MTVTLCLIDSLLSLDLLGFTRSGNHFYVNFDR